MNKNNALLVFIKNPEMGKVKSRLKPELSDKDCVSIYKALVNDLVKNIQTDKHYDVFFFFTPANSEKVLQKWLGYDFKYIQQSNGDLGARMNTALNWAFEHHYQKVLLIGSDIPTIDQRLILNAFRQLDRSDIVLGPSEDGGYYLIGAKEPQPQIFKDIHWSSEVVFSETAEKIAEKNLTMFKLETRLDVDTYSDILNLFHLITFSKNGYLSLMPETYKTLNEIIKKG